MSGGQRETRNSEIVRETETERVKVKQRLTPERYRDGRRETKRQ